MAVLIVTAASPAAEAAGALFISRNAQPEELAIEARLGTLGFEVTRMTDAAFSTSVKLTPFDLIVLTEFAPFLTSGEKTYMKSSGVPILIVSYWDHAYAQSFGLVNTSLDCDSEWYFDECESWGVTQLWPANATHDATAGLTDPFTAFSPDATVYDFDPYYLKSGVTPLVYSNHYEDRAVTFINESTRIAATGLFSNTRYTTDTWKHFDQLVRHLAGDFVAPLPPERGSLLLVSNRVNANELLLEQHLRRHGGFTVTTLAAASLTSSTDYTDFDAVVLTGTSTNMTTSAQAKLLNEGVPIVAMESGAFTWANRLGLSTTTSCTSTTATTIVSAEAGVSSVTLQVGAEPIVYSTSAPICGLAASALASGASGHFWSDVTSGRFAIISDSTRGIAASSLSTFSTYTTDAWKLFDLMLSELAPSPMADTYESLQDVAQAFVDSGLYDYVIAVRDELRRNPNGVSFASVEPNAWAIMARWNLFELWDFTRQTLGEIFGFTPSPPPIGGFAPLFTFPERPRNPENPPLTPGALPFDYPDEQELWFLGQQFDEDRAPPYTFTPPRFADLHNGTDLGLSVWHNGRTIFYMGDTWDLADQGCGITLCPIGTLCPTNPPVCNDIIALSTDTDPSDGVFALPYMERFPNRVGRMVMPGVHTEISSALNGYWPAANDPTALEPKFSVPTGAVATWRVFDVTHDTLPIHVDMPIVMAWYGTAIGPGTFDSSAPQTRPTSWAGCSLNGLSFKACYRNGAGSVVPFSEDVAHPSSFPGLLVPNTPTNPSLNNPARFIQVATVPVSDEEIGAVCEIDADAPLCQLPESGWRSGLLLYGTGRPYRFSGIFMGFIRNTDIGTLNPQTQKPLVYYWTGGGWSTNEAQAIAISFNGSTPSCDAYSSWLTCPEAPSVYPFGTMPYAGEISAKLVRGATIQDARIVLLSNANKDLLSFDEPNFPVAWVTSLIDPDLIAENEPQSLLTRGYGLYPIENGQEPTIGAFEIEGVDVPGVELHHLVSTWNGPQEFPSDQAPYGVFSGSEVVTW